MQQAESIQKIREFSFGKELARDHALYLCLCNLFIFFHLEPKKKEAKKKKKRKEKRITPDLRLEGLRKEREIFLFCFALTELDWNSVMIKEGWDKTKIQDGGRNGTLEVGQFLDKSDA